MSSNREFAGNARFSVRRRIGAGGMGVVYEVYDRERRAVVALKTLRLLDPRALFRFKQEFRSLVGIAHRNLVTLHELVSDGEDWLLTMEYVNGQRLLDYLHSGGDPAPSSDEAPDDADRSHRHRIDASDSSSGGDLPRARRRGPATNYELIESTFAQLANGIHALHEAGKLHRDIKPSNVLVDRDGRVVLLDFGLVTDLVRSPTSAISTGDHIVGTVSYMGPEQAIAADVGTPCDWYSFGVMLFEALTGTLPFEGAPLQVLMDKQQLVAPTPRSLVPEIPAHLDRLCSRLLAQKPQSRPGTLEILASLSQGQVIERSHHSYSRSATRVFFGREPQLVELRDALAESANGRPVLALVHGHSGMGKSALLDQFASVAAEEFGAEVISGRCYEAESVPFKALDALIDSLASRLAAMPKRLAEALVPRDRSSLARVFPVLKRVEAIADAPRNVHVTDSHELRARAAAALGELLGRYAIRQPVVLMIDDMQWGDVDSSSLLFDIIRAHDAPAILLVVSFRTEARDTSPALAHFLALLQTKPELKTFEVEVGALPLQEAVACAQSQLALPHAQGESLALAIARESGGSPFFIDELVRYLYSGHQLETDTAPSELEATSIARISLNDALLARLQALPDLARRCVEIIAIAARPLTRSIVSRAAGLAQGDTSFSVLRAGQLIRSTGNRGADVVETAHDRIRAAVVEALSPESRRQHHERLAHALESERGADPEDLAFHHRGAGNLERAGELSAAAGEFAFEALAFERAARLFRTALAELGDDAPRRNKLVERLGDAEWSAGRLSEAAAAYLEAAAAAPPDQALELRRRASEQLLRCGRVDDGLDAVRVVLRAVSIALSKTPNQALFSLAVRRVLLRLRGLGFKRRHASDIPASELARIDTCWSVASSMGPIDFIRGASLQSLHIILALRAGEPNRAARALAMEAYTLAVGGKRSERRARRARAHAKALNDTAPNPSTRALLIGAECQIEYQLGNWRAALAHGFAALECLEGECTGVYFEIATLRRWLLDSLFNLGELAILEEKASQWLRDAHRRGDAHLETELHTGLPSIVGLMRDRPKETRRLARTSIAKWPSERYLLQHYTANLAVVHAYLYEGRGQRAHQLVLQDWRPLNRSLLMRLQALATEAWFLRARTAVAASMESGASDVLEDAAHCAKMLARQRVPAGRGLSSAVRAMIADARGRPALAIEKYEEAIEQLTGADLRLFAESCRLRLGLLLGATDGDSRLRQARAWFQAHGVMEPDKLGGVFAPGFHLD